MSETFMHYLEERLYQWADWYSRGNFYGLGYPSCSMEYRMMTEGAVVRNTGPKQLPSNEAAEEMESLVKEMAEHNKTMADALRCQYFLPGSLRSKAAKLDISHSHFKHYVDMAHQWLAGRLSQG
jgi:hypothetical protein